MDPRAGTTREHRSPWGSPLCREVRKTGRSWAIQNRRSASRRNHRQIRPAILVTGCNAMSALAARPTTPRSAPPPARQTLGHRGHTALLRVIGLVGFIWAALLPAHGESTQAGIEGR